MMAIRQRIARLVTHHSVINTSITLFSMVVPLVAGFFAIPVLITQMGDERFGLLAIVWLALGYFSIFDFGIGRAVSFSVSERRGDDPNADTADIFATAVPLLLLLGVIAGLLLGLLRSDLVNSVLRVPSALRSEAATAFAVVALGLPFVTTTVGLRGFLEGHERFLVVAVIRAIMGASVFISPVLVLIWTKSLPAIVAALVASKVIGILAYGLVGFWAVKGSRESLSFSAQLAGRLLRYGGWLTVSNVISPIMVFMDRFLIGSLLSIAIVTYYVTPFEVVSKLLIVAGAASTVLFPLLTRQITAGEKSVHRDVVRGSVVLGLILLPAVLFFVIFAERFLSWWIDENLAANSAMVMQILAVGMLVNSIAVLPFISLQSANRPDITAKIHMLELPFYAVAIFGLTSAYGIVGTALAWLIRVGIDTVLMHFASWRVLKSLPDFDRKAAARGN